MAAKSALPKPREPAPLRAASPNASDRETLTPFGPTRANDRPPALGFHADQKAVGALATNDGRLIGAFHDGSGRPCGRIKLDDELKIDETKRQPSDKQILRKTRY
jgi:hypothetical protein